MDKLFTRIFEIIVSTLWIAPIRGMIIEIEVNLQLQLPCVNKINCSCGGKMGPNHNHLSSCV